MSTTPPLSPPETPSEIAAREARARTFALGTRGALVLAVAGLAVRIATTSQLARQWAASGPETASLARSIAHLATLAGSTGIVFTGYFWFQGQRARQPHSPEALPSRFRFIAWALVALVVALTALMFWYLTAQGLMRW